MGNTAYFVVEKIIMKLAFGLVLLVAVVALSMNAPEPRIIVEYANECAFVDESFCPEHDWMVHPYQKKDTTVKLVFAVKQLNTDSCDSLLLDVSSPTSENFGKIYSFEEVGAMFRNDEAIDATKQFLAKHGVTDVKVTPNGEFIIFEAEHELAEAILGTKFTKFISTVLNEEIIRARYYTLPQSLLEHVEFVGNVVTFPPTLKYPIFQSLDAAGMALTTPSVINKAYNIKNNKCSQEENSYAVFEVSGQQDYNADDLTAFQKQYGLPEDAIDNVIGKNNEKVCSGILGTQLCGEASLDVQYMLAVAQEGNSTYWAVPGINDPFLSWIEAVAADSKPPLVHSISYGSVETQNPDKSMKSFNNEACKLGLRRISVFIASGDDGVANVNARGNKSGCGFAPSYPASCPYITSVGATMGPEKTSEEVACQSDKGGLITTGGGFSTVFDAPSWQKDAIETYFKTAENLPPKDHFASTGRGYPDVSALGHNYPVTIGGKTAVVSGTSASSPVFAAITALVNDQRLAAGKTPIGFLNPILYSETVADALNDITSGNNKCAAGQFRPVCCDEGFYTAKGWDPVTGVGSVNFEKFAAALLALP